MTTTTTNMASSLFPALPTELRVQLWSFAVMHPRRILLDAQKLVLGPAWLSKTPASAVVHACQEARANAPYAKAFRPRWGAWPGLGTPEPNLSSTWLSWSPRARATSELIRSD
ncbi:uncharacterized protein B0I36DRAFT_319725 [Microdochium trichocladiopsis]|uniref:2EXR domain-containing protein n=1 Tax=Microdochium trichocladiopsis TaxID=1682393 RepID=A0A9P8Y5T8_9PEZI|nr:uncharacterized protein B0I36DRAFT_319725 [Microdochium trichocladiopsis]KAH7032610.1 hypothetical protein B0I36DRAFT_319725 [Microdochium trichocladiopsis]